jgi:hypothetical protein
MATVDPKRTVRELRELHPLTGNEDGAQRVAWTDTWLKARTWFAEKLKSLSAEHHMDEAGNVWATLYVSLRRPFSPAVTSTRFRTVAGWTAV